MSCLLGAGLRASGEAELFIEETALTQEPALSVYGYAKGVGDSREVRVTLSGAGGQTVELQSETTIIGNWEVENVDVSGFRDGEIDITAFIEDEAGQRVAQVNSTRLLDRSFSLTAYMNEHFAAAIFLLMVVLLLLGFPMKIPLFAGAILGVYLQYEGDLAKTQFVIQQMMAGIRPAALIAVPMFILSADIMTRGKSAEKLIDFVMAFVRHIKGGLAISTSGACALFGAVSGSTQATVVAIGSPLRPRLKAGGYKDSFILALIVNSSDIAFLIPPSIGMIIYGIVAKTSIPELFIAGLGPGLLILLLFSIYSFIYAWIHKIPTEPKASWHHRGTALYRAIWPLGFPVIIIGGIFAGIFSPTEAAAVSVAYAILLEGFIFRTMKLRDFYATALSTGLVTAVVFILVGAGTAFAWVLSYAQVPQELLAMIGIDEMGRYGVLFVISAAFFIGCMFVDPIVVILILVPIFAPVVDAAGLDPVLVGTIITLQVAIGSATPPFGCDLFTAIAVFKRPYFEVIKGTPPFIFILLSVALALIFFPQIALFLRDLAFQ
jgi:tripartite ATP-independent transporter DctM subunit